MTSLTSTIVIALAGALSIRFPLAASLVAAMVRSAVFVVYERLSASADEALPADPDVLVPDCGTCKDKRVEEGRPPRQLKRLPIEVTHSKDFKRKGLAVQLCEFCDGEALERSVATHAKRTEKKS